MAPSWHTTRNTVDRLDKPSSYAASKACGYIAAPGAMLMDVQNKRRRFNDRNRGRDDHDDNEGGREKTPEFEGKLREATTLYVGNL
ncbi:hypothetical protein LTS18_000442, partial [Coniosporium uncinatum]